MPIDGEPPGGDYASYISKLGDGSGVSPGAVNKPGKKARRGTSAAPAQWIRHDHNSHTEFELVQPQAADQPPASLGPQGSPRLAGVVQMVLGLLTLLLLARILVRMLHSYEPFALANLVPALLLAFIARTFLIHGRRKLREAKSLAAGKAAPQRAARQRPKR